MQDLILNYNFVFNVRNKNNVKNKELRIKNYIRKC